MITCISVEKRFTLDFTRPETTSRHRTLRKVIDKGVKMFTEKVFAFSVVFLTLKDFEAL